MMIDISAHSLLHSNTTTLKECSLDDTNGIYMTESTLNAVNFDEVKKIYLNNLHLSEDKAKSLDALMQIDSNDVFIEFKNGNMKNEKRAVKDKIRDSLLILFDIVKENISYSRENMIFILVYNENKNPFHSNGQIKSHILSLAKEEIIHFDLEKYQTLYFKEVHTYTEKEFENYLNKLKTNVS